MKICFVTTGDIQHIATAKRALGMANWLQQLGWHVSILMEDCQENHHRVSLECSSEIEVHYFPPSSLITEIKNKNKLLKTIQPDVVYICAFVTRNAVSTSSIKLVEHSELQSTFKGLPYPQRLRHLLFEYASLFYADGILNASKYLMKVFEKKANQTLRKIPQLYFPYAYSESVCQVLPKAEKTDNKIFIFIGSVIIEYGVLTLVKAFEQISTTHPQAKLWILGKGKDFNRVRKYVKDNELTNIEFKGYINEEDIPQLFSQADYFLSPMNDTIQDWARCPSKLYMYLPYQKPIVTCRIGEPFEVLGTEGIYYRPSDEESLATTIAELLDKKKETINIDPKLHSWKHRTQEFHEWFNQNFHINK